MLEETLERGLLTTGSQTLHLHPNQHSWNFVIQKEEKRTRGVAILDLILTNTEEMIEGIEVSKNFGEKEHVILELNIMQTQAVEHKQTSVLDF